MKTSTWLSAVIMVLVLHPSPRLRAQETGPGAVIEKIEILVDGRRIPVGGDIITAIDGEPVVTFEDILLYLTLNTRPGQQVVLTVLRDGEFQDITVTLQRRPDSPLP